MRTPTTIAQSIAQLWAEYPTIEDHPTRAGVRLALHPNGPVVVFGDGMDHMATPAGYLLYLSEGDAEAIELAQEAEWIALACFRRSACR